MQVNFHLTSSQPEVDYSHGEQMPPVLEFEAVNVSQCYIIKIAIRARIALDENSVVAFLKSREV
jgi:hypothetical protein